MSLAGRVIIITGGSNGIGKACVERLGRDGASVVVNYYSDEAGANALVSSIGEDRALAVQADASTMDGITKIIDEAVKKFGHIDVVMANAAMMMMRNVENTTEDDFDNMFKLNVKGPYFLAQKAAPHIRDGGSIIFVSTGICHHSVVLPDYLLYASTKGAIEQMTRVMAKGLAAKGITVNAVGPGPTATELFFKGKSEAQINALKKMNPFGRFGEPAEIASMVAFLAGPDSRWVSGQTYLVNGAYLLDIDIESLVPMPKMRLGWYAGASTALAGAVVFSAFQQRANFYSAMVYLSQSNFCLLILINFTLLIYGTFVYGLSQLCWGTLRTAEVEQLTERAWFAITETCLAMTIFRDELGAWFLVMFTALVTGKVWGWIGDGRVEFLEQQPPANPGLFHTRLTISLLMSFVYDVWILRYCINTVIQEARADMMVMFLFEFAVLATTSGRSGVRYILSIIEQKMIQTQTQARLLERKQEVREQRDAIIRQREEAAANGQSAENEEPLPNPDDIDEMDIEVPGWATKGEWVLWLDLLTDTVKLVLYVTFFVLLTIFYTFPIHIMRDLLMTARDFLKRLNSVLRYRRAIQEMNRYPDATQEELDQENTCIICREDMRVWDLNANPGALDRIRPKKLPCGHILHLGCLKSWLERQQVCPTCRSPVTPDRVPPTTNRNANLAPAAPQIPNHGLAAAQVGIAQEPRFGRFALQQALPDAAAQAGLNVDGLRRQVNAAVPAPQRPNAPNVRPMEEFHEMIRDEEQRRQEAEDRVRRRWRRVFPQDTFGAQPQNDPGQLQPPQQSTGPQLASGHQNLPSQSSQSVHPANMQGQQLSSAGQQSHHQIDPNFQRVVPVLQSDFTRQTLLNQSSALRSDRLRTLSNIYSQASVLVRQEVEALRISNEQLQVLGQLVNELERLEASHHDNADSPLPGPDGPSFDQILSQHPPGLPRNRSVPSRTDSPVMMRHGATSYSTSIPAGSPDLPEGVAIPPGWTLMPLQRLDNQHQTRPHSTQRSSRASSAGPATSSLGEERTAQLPVPQAPTSQPSQRTNVHVLERIPGTNNFRLSGSNGGVARSEPTTATGDVPTDAQPGAVITQQQLLDRFFSRGRDRESGSRTRSENLTRSTTATSSANATTDEQLPAAATASPSNAGPTSNIPNWGGSSQHFGSVVRSEPTENGTGASERKAAPPAAGSAQFTEDSDQSSSAASDSEGEEEDEGDDAEPVGSSKAAGKAVTVEEVSDEEDD